MVASRVGATSNPWRFTAIDFSHPDKKVFREIAGAGLLYDNN